MLRIDIKLLIFFLILCLIVFFIFIYNVMLNAAAAKDNTAAYNTNSNYTSANTDIHLEQSNNEHTIADKLESTNKELLDRLHLEKVKTFVILGTDERATEISRSDIIMVIKFNPETNQSVIVSVPRDTRVEIPGRKKDKINHAYAFGGPELSVKTLESLFDISIDYYLKFGFKDFITIVDDLNGIAIDAKKDFEEFGKVRIHKGMNKLNGEDALFYVRFRDDAEGDYGRIRRQQEVMRSLTDKILNFDKTKLTTIISKWYPIVVDTNMDFSSIRSYLQSIKGSEAVSLNAITLKTHSVIFNGIWYEEFNEEDLFKIKSLLKGEKNGTRIFGN